MSKETTLMSKELTAALAEIDRRKADLERLLEDMRMLALDDEAKRLKVTKAKPSIPPATTLVLAGEDCPPGAVRVSLSQPSDTRLILHILTPRDKEMSHGPWGIFNITLENGVVRITRGSFSGAYRADEHALEFDSEGRTVIHDDA